MAPSKFKAPLILNSSCSSSSLSGISEDCVRQKKCSKVARDSKSGGRGGTNNTCGDQAPSTSEDGAPVPKKKFSKANKSADVASSQPDKENTLPGTRNFFFNTDGKSPLNPLPTTENNRSTSKAGQLKSVVKLPCVTLTDEDYERIFQSVISTKTSDSQLFDVSTKDLFEITLTDLEDDDEENETKPDLGVAFTEVAHHAEVNVDLNESAPEAMVDFLCHPSQPGSEIFDSTAILNASFLQENVSKKLVPPPNSVANVSMPSQNAVDISLPVPSHESVASTTANSVIDDGNPTKSKSKNRKKSSLRSVTDHTAIGYQTPSKGVPSKTALQKTKNIVASTPVDRSQQSNSLKIRNSPLNERSSNILENISAVTLEQPPTGSVSPERTAQRTGSSLSLSTTSLSQGSQAVLSGSQLTQEYTLSQPPSALTARERLAWLQQKRAATGVWVQCDHAECGKWRYLPECHDPSSLPDRWFCSMNSDENLNSCGAPEKRMSLRAEEDLIFSKYSPGSVVWARLEGYPWWPAMVDDDPDLEMFYWINELSDIPTYYHVTFFDETQTYRAWIQTERLKTFISETKMVQEEEAYARRIAAAFKKANDALTLDVLARLRKYSFASNYKGPIGGGPSSVKYNGPLGFKERV